MHDHECCCEECNNVVLFQGDSVTDAGRNYDDPLNLGPGYPMLIAAWYQAMFPENCVQFVNRGVSGNRVRDLQTRWQKDCIDLDPSVVTILIGINDTWRRYDSNDPTSVEAFESGYRDILTRTREETDADIVLMEPFLLPTPEDRKLWRVDLDPKIHVVRELAREFEAVLIPLDGIFAQASAKRESEFWAADGVHPTLPGHALIAQTWLNIVQGI